MTSIAAKVNKDNIEMSCDSKLSRGYHGDIDSNFSKIIEGDDFLLGVSGNATSNSLLFVYCRNHPIGDGGISGILDWLTEFSDFVRRKTGNYPDTSNPMVVGHKSGLFAVESMIPVPRSDFHAIGSGFQYCVAVMHLGKDTKTAVSVAAELDNYSGGSVKTYKISTTQGKGQ